jgi:hypothetical protein
VDLEEEDSDLLESVVTADERELWALLSLLPDLDVLVDEDEDEEEPP